MKRVSAFEQKRFISAGKDLTILGQFSERPKGIQNLVYLVPTSFQISFILKNIAKL
jgi:hypothetical protein